MTADDPRDEPVRGGPRIPMTTIAREWTRIGLVGFGGPPTHIALFRKLCVVDRAWITESEFEDGIATTNLLPGPASTQLAIYCAWRLGGPAGAILGGVCFIVPGLIAILALSVLFLARHPPLWVDGASAGAGAAIAPVALHASVGLIPASWRRIGSRRSQRARWVGYGVAGGLGAAMAGPYLVVVLIGCGLIETTVRTPRRRASPSFCAFFGPSLFGLAGALGGIGALLFVAFKVGALSYGGGFVIVPLMQADAVSHYHWMTNGQFLDAVALGLVTPGPVVQTIAVIGYAASGLGGGLLAAFAAFSPSFAFILFGAPHFVRLRANSAIQAFLVGAGPAAIGAIGGAAIPLGHGVHHLWQLGILVAIGLWLFWLRRSVVIGLIAAGVIGVGAAFLGFPLQ